MATIVLIHGGFWGGWSWQKLKPLLEKDGHAVYTPTLTGLGERQHLNHPLVTLDTHIRDIKNLIEYEDLRDVILVGHSYGGLVIPAVASLLPTRIRRLVYLDALIPDNGDSLLTLVEKETAEFFVSQAKEKGFGWLIPPFPYTVDDFADKNEFEWCTSRLTPQSLASFEQKVTFSEATTNRIPSVFIHCTESYSIMLVMKAKAQKKGWDCFEIASNHFPMLGHAHELNNLLIKIIHRNFS
jgi:pimeloyl-ACP methyl ester carboxylesterase